MELLPIYPVHAASPSKGTHFKVVITLRNICMKFFSFHCQHHLSTTALQISQSWIRDVMAKLDIIFNSARGRISGNAQLSHRTFFTTSRKAFYRCLVSTGCFQIPTTIYNTSNHIPVTTPDDRSLKKPTIYLLPEEGQVQCWQRLTSYSCLFLNDKLNFLKWMFMLFIIKTSTDF